jgi:hypothetical protein
MPRRYKKSIRKYKKTTKKNKKVIRKTRNNRKTINNIKGGNGDKVNCCMCGKEIDVKKGNIPLACLKKNFSKAHRICQDCWWSNETGFSREDADHRCPGCLKKLPLTNITSKEPTIDLTQDD